MREKPVPRVEGNGLISDGYGDWMLHSRHPLMDNIENYKSATKRE